MFTRLDYSSALEYSIIRRYTNIVYYYYVVLWLLKSPITICGRFLWPRAGSSNGSFGGLYTECTTTPGITIVMCSTVPWTLS